MNTQTAWERFSRSDPYFAVYPWAKSQDDFFQSGEKIVSHLMDNARLLHAGPFNRALDFGCGLGRITIPLSHHCKEIVGVDHSEGMLEQARKNGPGITFASTPGGGRFDLITCLYVFQHIPHDRGIEVLRDLLGRLTDEGLAILHFQYAAKSPVLAFVHFLKRHFGFVNLLINILQRKSLNTPRMIMVPYPVDELVREFKAAGMGTFFAEWEKARDFHGLIFYLRKGHEISVQG